MVRIDIASPDHKREIGELVRATRIAKGITIQGLAAMASTEDRKVWHGAVQRIENPELEGRWNLETALRLLAALGFGVAHVVEVETEPSA